MKLPVKPCSNAAEHTPDQPTGYLAWHAWAEQMSKTHRQRRCPGCGLFRIWELHTIPGTGRCARPTRAGVRLSGGAEPVRTHPETP